MNTENILTELCVIEQKIESLLDVVKNERGSPSTDIEYHLVGALTHVQSAKSELEPPKTEP